MNVEEMHIDFRNKLNKTDSLNEQNIRLQDIDFQLNLSQNILVKLAAFPRRFTNYFGLSINQRSLDDMRTISAELRPELCRYQDCQVTK